MDFYGLQKLTLLDYPGKVACTLFTAGCNFRCPFCHNAALVTHHFSSPAYSEEDILSFLAKRKGILDGVCITGGEPLLHTDLPAFLGAVKNLGYAVKLDTNGSFPKRLISLVEEGLVDTVAMDIKNSPERYAETCGLASVDIESISQSIRFLLSDPIAYEFRTTVVRELHTMEDIENIGKWIRGARQYYLQHFVDSGNLLGSTAGVCTLHAVSKEEMTLMTNFLRKYVQNADIRGA